MNKQTFFTDYRSRKLTLSLITTENAQAMYAWLSWVWRCSVIDRRSVHSTNGDMGQYWMQMKGYRDQLWALITLWWSENELIQNSCEWEEGLHVMYSGRKAYLWSGELKRLDHTCKILHKIIRNKVKGLDCLQHCFCKQLIEIKIRGKTLSGLAGSYLWLFIYYFIPTVMLLTSVEADG